MKDNRPIHLGWQTKSFPVAGEVSSRGVGSVEIGLRLVWMRKKEELIVFGRLQVKVDGPTFTPASDDRSLGVPRWALVWAAR